MLRRTLLTLPELGTPALWLRPPHLVDLADWVAIRTDERARQFVNWGPAADADRAARHFSASRLNRSPNLALGDWGALSAFKGAAYAGEVSAQPLRGRRVDIGWLVHPDHRGAGVGYTLARTLVDHVFWTTRTRIVTAEIVTGNGASEHIADRLGMRQVDRELVVWRDKRLVSVGRYVLTRDEWIDQP